jgi:type IV pilus assembly protein PilO
MRRPGILIGIAVTLLVTVVWWLFIVGPRRARLDELDTQIESARSQEQSLRAQKAQLLEIQENELTFITAGAELARNIPPTPELASFIDDVNLLAAETGIELLSLSPGLPTPSPLGTYQQISVSLEIQGQYFELLGFLYGLSDLERLVVINSIALSPGSAVDGPLLISAGLEARIFTTAATTPVEPPPDTEGGTTTTTVPAGATTTTTPASATTTSTTTVTGTTIIGTTTTTIGGLGP